MRTLQLCCLPLAVLALPLRAQQPPPAAAPLDLSLEMEDILSTDQIGAASKHVQDVASAPADVVVLRSSELQALGYRTLGDAIGGVLGFRSNQDHAYQELASAGVYSLDDQNTRVLVMLDGHALNSPAEVGSGKLGEDFGLPLELVDHIEVVRGPASSLYGNNAFQALINVVSKSAAGDRQSPLQAAVTAGSGGLAEFWVQPTFTLDGITSSLMLSGYQRSGSAQDYPQLQAEPLPAAADREERQSAYLYVKGPQWSFAGALVSRTQLLASGPFGSVAGSLDNFYLNRRMSGEFKWEPVTENVHWMVRLFGDKNQFDDGFLRIVSPTQDQLVGDRDPDRSVGAELQGRLSLGEHFSLTAGTEQQFHRYDGVFTGPGQEVCNDAAYSVGNSYLEGNWQPSASWNLVAGLQRADWRPGQVQNTVNGVAQGLDSASISRLTPRLSVIWKAGSGDVVKFIYGQGFRFPTIYEAYYTDGQSQSPNPSMHPEVLTSYQVAWSRKWNPQWTSQGSVSLSRGQNAIQSSILPNGMLQYQNAPDPVQGRVIQWETAWHHGGTELSGGAGYYHWSYQGAPRANSAPYLGVFKAIQRLGDWSLAGEARYVDARQSTDPSSGTVTQVPANWTLRSSLRREWTGAWAQVSVEDLTNSRCRDLVAPEYAPITWMEGDGRALRATVGVRF